MKYEENNLKNRFFYSTIQNIFIFYYFYLKM